jgi:hypothetical protein
MEMTGITGLADPRLLLSSMNILDWFPDWLFYTSWLLGVGLFVATIVLKFIPIIYMKKVPLQFGAIALITIGAFMSGAAYNQMSWQLRVKEMEAKVAQAQAQSAEKNVEIIEKIVFKDRVIREQGEEIIKYIDKIVVEKEEIVKFVENCPLPPELIDAHNRAVRINNR